MSEQKKDKEVTPDANNEESVDNKAEEVKKAEEVQPEAVKEKESPKEEQVKSEAAEQPEAKQAEQVEEDKAEEKDEIQEEVKADQEASEKESEEVDESVQEAKEKIKGQEFKGDLDFYTQLRDDLPEIKPGDILQVSYRVIEGGKERTQIFEGTVIAIKNKGITKTITVRKTSFGIAVERIFPLNSKLVQKIEIKRHSKVRRAKLYFLRKLKGKAARLKELR